MDKKFHLFQYDNYYPSGGMSDYKGSYATLEEARADMERYDFWEIAKVNEEGELEIVESSYHA